MSIQRIDDDANHTHGGQVRAYVGLRRGTRITKFFSDKKYGGMWLAQIAAYREQDSLKLKARRIRRKLGLHK